MSENRKRPRYTAKDIKWLQLLFKQGRTDSEIAQIMGRPLTGIVQKRRKLRLHRPDCIAITQASCHHWDEDELEFIYNFWRELSDTRMARKLGVTLSCYKHKRLSMGLRKEWERRKGRRRTWSFNDELFLRENYGTRSAKEIAKYLNRKENAVQYKAYRLGLSKDYHPGRRGYQPIGN